MPAPSELYSCLHAREFPAQALLRLRPELRNQPCAVIEGEPPMQYVCALNTQARKIGIALGNTLVELDTFPTVTVLQRSLAEEATARQVMLECAGAISPRVEDCSGNNNFACGIDIAGTEKLMGAPPVLARNLLTRIKSLGIDASIAVSQNFHAANCLARGLRQPEAIYRQPEAIYIVAAGEERAALAPLPLSVLDLSGQHAETLSHWGITTLGMLAELPETELIARLGQPAKQLRQLARGELPHLFRPTEPAITFEERMQLDSPVEILESLLFVVRVMLEQLIARAHVRVIALAAVTITLVLEGGTFHSRNVQPALPSNDQNLWLKLLQLELDAHPPVAAVTALTLTAEPGRTSKVQLGLFTPQTPEAGRLDITLARIRAIVGEGNAGRAQLRDSQRSEAFRPHAHRVEKFQLQQSQLQVKSTAPSPFALRIIRPPERISVAIYASHPQTFAFREKQYIVEHAYGPWLFSGEWWHPAAWNTEQWDLIARAQQGASLCCCIVRDVAQNQWHMAALYD